MSVIYSIYGASVLLNTKEPGCGGLRGSRGLGMWWLIRGCGGSVVFLKTTVFYLKKT
jgi:hypothetical protein